ncbi:MAG: cytochrome P450 [Pseudomonadota bacterium]
MTETVLKTEEPEKRVIEMPTADYWDMEAPLLDAADIPLEEINMMNPRYFAEDKIWDYFERLRNEDPVHFNEMEWSGRFWSLTRYEDIVELDKDHRNFSSAHGIGLGLPIDAKLPDDVLSPSEMGMFIAMDEPKHAKQRKTVSPIVAPASLQILESTIRERAAKILDSLPIGEEIDWVDLVSIELTTQMLATLFDFPFEDRRKLTRWSDVTTTVPGAGLIDSEEQRKQELLECLTAFSQLWQERKENPGHDLISMLVHGEETKNMVQEDPLEFLGNLLLLIVGGNDTTRNSISGGVVGLNKFPEQYQKLREDVSLIPNMVSEVIRWQTPLPYMRRTANQDCMIRDKQIKAGDQVIMWYVSGNRDPERFENPNDFIIDRPNARQHVSFGFGIHRCMGNRLAEMQLRILWEEMMQRFHFVEIVGEPERTMSSFIKGYTKLPVIVHAK